MTAFSTKMYVYLTETDRGNRENYKTMTSALTGTYEAIIHISIPNPSTDLAVDFSLAADIGDIGNIVEQDPIVAASVTGVLMYADGTVTVKTVTNPSTVKNTFNLTSSNFVYWHEDMEGLSHPFSGGNFDEFQITNNSGNDVTFSFICFSNA